MTNTTTGDRTVVGLFDSMETANRAADELRQAGIDRGQISIIAGNESDRYSQYVGADEATKDVASRAGTGAAIGGGLGLVAGLVALAIPGFGPIIAAGPIAAALGGAAAGAATGGLIGGLTAAGVSENDARLYERRLRDGGVLLTVRTSDEMSDEVADILDNNGARDVDEDSTMQTQTSQTTQTSHRDYTHSSGTGEKSIPVIQERVDIGKREVGHRAVRVYSNVQENPVERDIELREENIRIERRPADRPATDADLSAFREGTIELTETREEPVVRKDTRVVEEVIVGKDVNTTRHTVRDTERRTDVRVEETGSGSDPGYTFGSTWADDARYRDRDWSTVEPDLRRDWDTRGHGTWDEFKDSIQRGWDKVRGRR